MVVEIIAGFADGFIGNADNYFLYDNLAENRFTFLANDFDITAGATIIKLADQWSGNYTQYPGFSSRPLTQKMIQVPEFKSQFENLLYNVTQQLIHPNILYPRIDSLVQMIREDVEWDSTLPRVNPDPVIDLSEVFKARNSSEIIVDPKWLSPPMDYDTIMEMQNRSSIDFDTAITGPTHLISLSGVKEWFGTQSQAIQDYFSQHPPFSLPS